MSKELKIATIGGGSSYTPEIVEGFINKAVNEELLIKELWLVDIPAGREKMDIVGNLASRMVAKAGNPFKVILTEDRRAAISGADFVTTQFRVGLLDARIRDERIPLKYGLIGQETNGAGGFAKALRTIPVIRDICRDIEELAPTAWLLNFTNPSGMITETVLKHSKVNVIGLCNVPINVKMNIAKLLDVEPDRLFIEFAGINHLIWGRKVFLDGKDVTQEVLDGLADSTNFAVRNIRPIAWGKELLDQIGMAPCPYHRYYYMTDKMFEEELTDAAPGGKGVRGEVVKGVETELFELYKDPNLAIKPPQLTQRGGTHYSDAAVNLMAAIVNNKQNLHVVNIRNNGAIPDLPDDVAVELNCIVGSHGAIPLSVGHMPPQARGLLQQLKSFEILTIEAGVTGDYTTALRALAANPLVPHGKIAKQLLDEILEVNAEYLPQFRKS